MNALKWIFVVLVLAVSGYGLKAGADARQATERERIADAGGKLLRATYSPLHFKPEIESATDAQCLINGILLVGDRIGDWGVQVARDSYGEPQVRVEVFQFINRALACTIWAHRQIISHSDFQNCITADEMKKLQISDASPPFTSEQLLRRQLITGLGNNMPQSSPP